MTHWLLTLLLGPLLLYQGRRVRRNIPLLPEPPGERTGVAGTGPPLHLLVTGDSALQPGCQPHGRRRFPPRPGHLPGVGHARRAPDAGGSVVTRFLDEGVTRMNLPSLATRKCRRPVPMALLAALLLLLFTSAGVQASGPGQTPPPAPAPVQSLADVGRAVVRIQVIGAYQDEPGAADFHLRGGTGFLIDPSGLVITNNHVVAGSQTILVYLDGEERPHNAALLALSECSDLALLSLVGEGYPYLAWDLNRLERGQTVHAFGFASGDLKRSQGEIRGVEQGYDSNIASSLETVLHTARVSPGDSGGPLTNAQGEVVGVNYGGGSSSGRGVAISASEVQATLGTMQKNPRAGTLGISGEAWAEGNRQGIWIRAVQPNMPADLAGLAMGDVLLGLGGKAASDGENMAAYCDILRAWDGDEVLEYELLSSGRRTSIRSGQLGPVPQESGQTDADFVWETLRTVEFQRPAAWGDVLISEGKDVGSLRLEAAPDRELFTNALGTAPLIVELLADDFARATTGGLLDSLEFADYCAEKKRFPHTHTSRTVGYTGEYDRWEGCGDGLQVLYTGILRSSPGAQTILVLFLSLAVEDDSAFDVLLRSFRPALTAADGEQAKAGGQESDATTARILATSLNLRTGPGTEYGQVGALPQGSQVTIVGRNMACTWLRVQTPTGGEAWISANPAYVAFSPPCVQFPVREIAAPLPPAPAPAPTPSAQTPPAQGESDDGLNPSLGCYLFENGLGAEVTVTFTRQEQPWNITFQVADNQSYNQCFAPGRYTYTLDAPPPWNSVNGELGIEAGDRYRFPIQGR
jgi:serine protease Do